MASIDLHVLFWLAMVLFWLAMASWHFDDKSHKRKYASLKADRDYLFNAREAVVQRNNGLRERIVEIDKERAKDMKAWGAAIDLLSSDNQALIARNDAQEKAIAALKGVVKRYEAMPRVDGKALRERLTQAGTAINWAQVYILEAELKAKSKSA